MKILQQSPTLKAKFQQKINTKKANEHEKIIEQHGGGLFGRAFGGVDLFMYELKQVKNQVKGSVGEWGVSMMLQYFPDSWIMFNNAFIPTSQAGNLTEIDHLIIGTKGVFLLEVKTWKGSFSANRDNWKRRDGNSWIPVENSPTGQSAYHQKMFQRWINTCIPHLPDNFVHAPVVFPIAKWLGVSNCSAPVFQGVNPLLQMISDCPNCLTLEQVESIANIIVNYQLRNPDSFISQPNSTSTSTSKPKPILKKDREN